MQDFLSLAAFLLAWQPREPQQMPLEGAQPPLRAPAGPKSVFVQTYVHTHTQMVCTCIRVLKSKQNHAPCPRLHCCKTLLSSPRRGTPRTQHGRPVSSTHSSTRSSWGPPRPYGLATSTPIVTETCSPSPALPKTRQWPGDITSWVRVTPRDPWRTSSTYHRVPCTGSGLGLLLGYFQQLRNGSRAPSSLSSENISRLPACPAIPGRGMGTARSHRSFWHRSQARSDLSSPRPTLQPCSSALPHFQSLQTRESLHTKTIPPQRETS